MATFQGFLDALTTQGAAAAGIAAADVDDPATDANAPDLDELVDASADRADTAGDGPDVDPIYEPARPLVDDTIDPVNHRGGKARPYGVPVPAGSSAFTGDPDPGGSGLPVMVVPASGGRARTVVLRNISGGSQAVKLYTERSGSSGPSTPPPGGFTLPAGERLETATQGPIYVAADGAWQVCAWVDTYGDPASDAP